MRELFVSCVAKAQENPIFIIVMLILLVAYTLYLQRRPSSTATSSTTATTATIRIANNNHNRSDANAAIRPPPMNDATNITTWFVKLDSFLVTCAPEQKLQALISLIDDELLEKLVNQYGDIGAHFKTYEDLKREIV